MQISLKGLRVDRGLSRKEVAEYIGMSTSGSRALEQRNGRGLKVEKLKKLCELYDITLENLRIENDNHKGVIKLK